jgi:hypothetical protein
MPVAPKFAAALAVSSTDSLDTTTVAPAAMKASAIPRPIPREDPVMIATLPASEKALAIDR